jgi:aquaglyceroporin related protein
MADRGNTSSIDYESSSQKWIDSKEDQRSQSPNALHKFPTHEDVPQGNVQHHEYAQREALPRVEKGDRGVGNGADFDTTQNTTTSQIGTTRRFLGLHPQAPIEKEHDRGEHADLLLPRIRGALKEPLAEFFGTMVLVLFGNGSVAQVLLSAGSAAAPGGDGFGNYQSINWGWGLGVMLGIYVAGDSGAYLK